jgi:hypothetical protein
VQNRPHLCLKVSKYPPDALFRDDWSSHTVFCGCSSCCLPCVQEELGLLSVKEIIDFRLDCQKDCLQRHLDPTGDSASIDKSTVKDGKRLSTINAEVGTRSEKGQHCDRQHQGAKRIRAQQCRRCRLYVEVAANVYAFEGIGIIVD